MPEQGRSFDWFGDEVLGRKPAAPLEYAYAPAGLRQATGGDAPAES